MQIRFSAPVALRGKVPNAAAAGEVFRTYDVAALMPDGTHRVEQFRAPALPYFDAAFSALSQGTQVTTPVGLVAIEDLAPGDAVRTRDHGDLPVQWIGTSTFLARAPRGGTPLVRFTSGSFGPARPAHCVTFGPAARLMQTPPVLRAQGHKPGSMTPVQAFVDGVSVIDVAPPTPVRLFHLGLETHAIIDVGGIGIESYHPDPVDFRSALKVHEDIFFRMFPGRSSLADFGPSNYPRIVLSPDGLPGSRAGLV